MSTYLAKAGNVAASTQNQALAALLFLYKKVLGVDLPWLGDGSSRRDPAGIMITADRRL